MSRRLGLVACLATVALTGSTPGCGDDDPAAAAPDAAGAASDSETDTGGASDTGSPPDVADVPTPLPSSVIAFGLKRGQLLSEGPFPSDILRADDGHIDMGPLGEDARLDGMGKPALLDIYDAHIAEREGFASTAAVWFFLAEAPDVSSFEGRVELVALSGPEAGKVVPTRVFYDERTGGLGAFPDFGHYLLADSTWAAIIRTGPKTAAGATIESPDDFATVMSADAPSGDADLERAWTIYAPLRDWVSGQSDLETDGLLVATVFTTEPVLEYGEKLIAAVDAYELKPPTRDVRWDKESGQMETAVPMVTPEAMLGFMGTPTAPFEHNPGVWGSWNRAHAADLPGVAEPYAGGTGHFGVGAALSGSITVPVYNFAPGADGALVNQRIEWSDGAAHSQLDAMVPFILYLCEPHLVDPSNVPVAVFNHGGGATRSDAIGYANANCRAGVATISIDMVFHGSRHRTTYLADQKLMVPTKVDEHNVFTGKSAGDPGFVADYIGDPAPGAESVAPLFAIEADADPLIVEANLLSLVTDTYTLVRLLEEGDWSQIHDGLSFDLTRLFHNSISFGTSLSTPLLALTDKFAGVVSSVGTAYVLSINMPMAPSNGVQASGIIFLSLGLQSPPTELQSGSYENLMLGLHAWLHERADPLPWAPYVLRHRPSGGLPPILSNGNSWDETLFNPAQVTYANALGLVPYTAGDEWTLDASVPGADAWAATPFPEAGVTGNASYDSGVATAAIFYRATACHGQVLTSVCTESYVHPYPPIKALEETQSAPSPVCQLHGQIRTFVESVLSGEPKIVAPGGTCAELYGP